MSAAIILIGGLFAILIITLSVLLIMQVLRNKIGHCAANLDPTKTPVTRNMKECAKGAFDQKTCNDMAKEHNCHWVDLGYCKRNTTSSTNPKLKLTKCKNLTYDDCVSAKNQQNFANLGCVWHGPKPPGKLQCVAAHMKGKCSAVDDSYSDACSGFNNPDDCRKTGLTPTAGDKGSAGADGKIYDKCTWGTVEPSQKIVTACKKFTNMSDCETAKLKGADIESSQPEYRCNWGFVKQQPKNIS